MRIFRQLIILIFLTAVVGSASADTVGNDEAIDLEELYQQIDEAISQSPTYVAERERQISACRDCLYKEKDVEKKMEKAEQLFRYYQAYKSDSAIYYLSQCISLSESLHRPDAVGRYRSMLAYQYSNNGMYIESLDQLHLVSKAVLDNQGLVAYYNAWMHVYGEMGTYTQDESMRLSHFASQDHYRDSVLMVTDESSEDYLHLKMDILSARRFFQDALELSDKWLGIVEDHTHESAYAAFYRSMVFEKLGNHEMVRYWLGKSAIDDIKSVTMNQASLLFLAGHLADDGDISRAYRYAEFAKDCNLSFYPRLRTYQVDAVIKVIEKSSQASQARADRILLVASVVIVLLIVALFYTIWRKKE